MSSTSILICVLFCALASVSVNLAQASRPAHWRLFVGPIRAEAPRVITLADGSVQSGVETKSASVAL